MSKRRNQPRPSQRSPEEIWQDETGKRFAKWCEQNGAVPSVRMVLDSNGIQPLGVIYFVRRPKPQG